MSTTKSFTQTTRVTQPVMQAVMHGPARKLFRFHMPRFLLWLARHGQEKSSIEPGNERLGEGGYYCISVEQAALERTLDVQMVKLMTTPSR